MQDKEFAAILQDEPMQPLALVPLTEEEQVCDLHTNSSMHRRWQMLNFCSLSYKLQHDRTWFQSKLFYWLTNVTVSSHSSHSSLLLFPFSISLQRNFSMSVNSVAVLRLMGKGVGGATPAGVVRGRGATRGGRGKN